VGELPSRSRKYPPVYYPVVTTSVATARRRRKCSESSTTTRRPRCYMTIEKRENVPEQRALGRKNAAPAGPFPHDEPFSPTVN